MSAPGAGSLVVVTGADRGIGLELVRVLARRGVRTVLGSRDGDRGRAAARGLEGHVVVRRLDVTSQEDVDALADWVRAEHGGLDALVNNAGAHYDTGQPAVAADLRVVQEALAVNTVGPWRTAIALAPLLRRGGRIVNVSSGAGSFGETGGSGGVPAY